MNKQAVSYQPGTTAVQNGNILSILNLSVPFQGTFRMGEGLQVQMQNHDKIYQH